jgi:hypothetical protein
MRYLRLGRNRSYNQIRFGERVGRPTVAVRENLAHSSRYLAGRRQRLAAALAENRGT